MMGRFRRSYDGRLFNVHWISREVETIDDFGYRTKHPLAHIREAYEALDDDARSMLGEQNLAIIKKLKEECTEWARLAGIWRADLDQVEAERNQLKKENDQLWKDAEKQSTEQLCDNLAFSAEVNRLNEELKEYGPDYVDELQQSIDERNVTICHLKSNLARLQEKLEQIGGILDLLHLMPNLEKPIRDMKNIIATEVPILEKSNPPASEEPKMDGEQFMDYPEGEPCFTEAEAPADTEEILEEGFSMDWKTARKLDAEINEAPVDLEPCPACNIAGENNSEIKTLAGISMRYQFVCIKCGHSGPWAETPEAARAAWNKLCGKLADVVEIVERLRRIQIHASEKCDSSDPDYIEFRVQLDGLLECFIAPKWIPSYADHRLAERVRHLMKTARTDCSPDAWFLKLHRGVRDEGTIVQFESDLLEKERE